MPPHSLCHAPPHSLAQLTLRSQSNNVWTIVVEDAAGEPSLQKRLLTILKFRLFLPAFRRASGVWQHIR